MSTFSLREAVKLRIEKGLLATGIGRVQRARHSDSVLVLAYHNVLDDLEPGDGDRALHLRKSRFCEQLDYLARTHTVVPLHSVLPATPSKADRPRVAITFDDAYAGALTEAVPELVRRGMPATIFVAPGCLGTDSFWWDALASRTAAGLPDPLRAVALEQLGGEDSRIRRWARETGHALHDVGSPMRPASVRLLQQVAQLPGISFGSHTWSHPNLAVATIDRASEELRSSLQWLRERFSNVIPWLAYPYGSYDGRIRKLAEQLGYRGAVRIDGGWVPRTAPQRYDVPRLTVSAGLSIDGFALRASGVLRT